MRVRNSSFSLLVTTILTIVTCLVNSYPHSHEAYSAAINDQEGIATSALGASPHRALSQHDHPRALVNMGASGTIHSHGWLIRYRKIFSMIIPVEVAASVLEDFLSGAIFCVGKQAAATTVKPGTAITMSMGSVFLGVRTAADSSVEMTWQALQAILEVMLDHVQKGWTTEFKSEWYLEEMGMRIWVSLSMLRNFGPGPNGLD